MVRFDPTLDWKTETEKAEQGHLRRLAEREIKKRLDLQRQLQRVGSSEWYSRSPHPPHLPTEDCHLSRADRLNEAFLYVVFCDVDLLVHQYRFSDSVVLRRMLDRLLEDAGILLPFETQDTHTAATDADAIVVKVWTSLVALQRKYRKIYDESKTNWFGDNLVSALGRTSSQALFFVHWLAPAFQPEVKDYQRCHTHFCILGDREASARFEEYVCGDGFEGTIQQMGLNDLRWQLILFWRLIFGSSTPPLTGTIGSDKVLPAGTFCSDELRAWFAAFRRANAGARNWASACCKGAAPNGKQCFAYESLSGESKGSLFLIGSMPAFRDFLKSTRKRNLPSQHNGWFIGDCDNPCCGGHETESSSHNAPYNCDCPSISHDDCECTQEICNLWFERT